VAKNCDSINIELSKGKTSPGENGVIMSHWSCFGFFGPWRRRLSLVYSTYLSYIWFSFHFPKKVKG